VKIALYIEDGLEQIVLSAQTKSEQSILDKLHDGDRSLSIKKGGFYECQGGWVRHGTYDPDHSTILVLRAISKDDEP
jgi:hypothetical protein